jgi:hypothetical protein
MMSDMRTIFLPISTQHATSAVPSTDRWCLSFGNESHGRRKSIRGECSLCSHLEQVMAFLRVKYDVRYPDTHWTVALVRHR